MEIIFKKPKLEKHFITMKALTKKYGPVNARYLAKVFKQLSRANTLNDIPTIERPRLHKLTGDLADYFAVDGKHPYRLILLPVGEYDKADLSTVTKIEIIDVIDYH